MELQICLSSSLLVQIMSLYGPSQLMMGILASCSRQNMRGRTYTRIFPMPVYAPTEQRRVYVCHLHRAGWIGMAILFFSSPEIIPAGNFTSRIALRGGLSPRLSVQSSGCSGKVPAGLDKLCVHHFTNKLRHTHQDNVLCNAGQDLLILPLLLHHTLLPLLSYHL